MLGLPTSEWRARTWSEAEALAAAPARAAWRHAGDVDHVFTHFALRLAIYVARGEAQTDSLAWTPLEAAHAGLPSLFRKALARALEPARGPGSS